jgi:DNA polymerase-3 subunit delta
MNQTLRRSGKSMEQSACETLAFSSGRDLTLLQGELSKLAAYVQEREVITQADVEQVATKTPESTVFAMVDAISARRAQEAFSLLNILLHSGEQRIGILAMITRHYRQMLHLAAMREGRVAQPQMLKTLGVPPFVLTKLTRQISSRSFESLRRDVEMCVEADYDIKRGAVREDAALDRLMLNLLSN